MSKTNHRPLVNSKKIEKLEALSKKFDLSVDKAVNPLRKRKQRKTSDPERNQPETLVVVKSIRCLFATPKPAGLKR